MLLTLGRSLLVTLGRPRYSHGSFSLPFLLQRLRFSECILRLFDFEDEYFTPRMIGPLDAHKGDISYDFHLTSGLTNVID